MFRQTSGISVLVSGKLGFGLRFFLEAESAFFSRMKKKGTYVPGMFSPDQSFTGTLWANRPRSSSDMPMAMP